MGDWHQYNLVKNNLPRLKGPVLEVGSKFYGEDVSFNFRELFADSDFLGCDMLPGKNVDVVCDFTQPFDVIDQVLKGKRFQTILCGSVLEHCSEPFKMADNLTKILRPNGTLFISVPFVFGIHGYPDDYWRFTPRGVEKLFPKLRFDENDGCITSADHLESEVHPLTRLPGYEIDFRTARHKREKAWGRWISSLLLTLFSKIGLFSWFTRFRVALPVTTVNMFGTKSGLSESTVSEN